ncbi:MAG: phosphoribosylformylglycinamidine synthase [Phycisphaerales bacterium]|nr:phosphoribosylformylglycinamidine synthase [Phycisphaerales bacterium]
MSIWGVALTARRAEWDVRGRSALADIHRRGRSYIGRVDGASIYLFRGDLNATAMERLAVELLADRVTDTFRVFEGMAAPFDCRAAVEVHYQPGVMDPAAGSTLAAARRLAEAGVLGEGVRIDEVRTARRFHIDGVRDAAELEWLARDVLSNGCIETAYLNGLGRSDALPTAFPVAPEQPFVRRTVSIREMDDASLAELSRRGHLFLSLAEMKAIQARFAAMDRDPTDLELETFAQTWSEHCVHKTLKSEIVYRGEDFGRAGEVEVRFDNLLKSTIVEATRRLNRDWCLSVFQDNAGIIAFDDDYGIAFKVETHNHPSAIEPYGGAATGVGGCIRDILGCGLGAKPVASTDVFCLAPPDWPEERVPAGVLHPRRVLNGVVGGVRDYGNRMGIPTVNGAIHFDERYLANPLVFCGCVGLIPRDRIAKSPRVGDRIVLVGGRTGRDGIHGATFSSAELTDTHADEFAHAVQIGNAIEEKKVLDAILAARDHASGCLFSAITDCGAGGLSSAVGEMAETLGADVDLERVPLKYAGLRYDEIWISEAQERMVLAVGESRLNELLAVFRAEGVEATVIGTFRGDRVLRVRYRGTVVGELDTAFLHHGLPRTVRRAEWRRPAVQTKSSAPPRGDVSIGDRLLTRLGDWNVASKAWVIRQYDHEVQGGSVVKPLVGPGEGPSDAAVLRPRLDSERGVAVGCGLCPQEASDPYVMAVRAVDEALRNVICVGGDPDRTAILDNFCWGEVESAESLGALVRACVGARDAAVAYGLPFISGKDSLNNQFSMSAEEAKRVGLPARLSIPPTLLISAISIMDDVQHCVTADLKRVGNRLFAVDVGSWTDLAAAGGGHRRVASWIREGRVLAAHDVNDDGLAVAIAEMCIGGDFGAVLRLDGLSSDGDVATVLFGDGRWRYLLECTDGRPLDGPGVIGIGEVTGDACLRIETSGRTAATVTVDAMRRAWRSRMGESGGA